jgi:hypothetical protein
MNCSAENGLNQKNKGNIIRVPGDFQTIAQAVTQSKSGDLIVLSPGMYLESEITIDKPIVITSEWKLDGDVAKIEETIIDANDKSLFAIKANGVEISGLKIINGDHPLDISANVIIKYNHLSNNKDAISFEGSGGGYAGYNTIENDRDDGIDLDIRRGEKNTGSDITIEYNKITNSNDDGIEIRLYDYPDQNIKYNIGNNTISGSKNAGIQLISYDIFTGKEFKIHHNILRDCKVGLGCMEGTNTKENLDGASTMDERIYFYNNTLSGNQIGATGGNYVYAMNNVVVNNKLGGLKRFGKGSAIINNLFFQNGAADFIELNPNVMSGSNLLEIAPLLDEKTFAPVENSPCVNSGVKYLDLTGKRIIEIDRKNFVGNKPDIGAIEFKK